MVASNLSLGVLKLRKKEAFPAILGETYELVTDKFRLLAQKVANNHGQNENIIAIELEGEDYIVRGY